MTKRELSAAKLFPADLCASWPFLLPSRHWGVTGPCVTLPHLWTLARIPDPALSDGHALLLLFAEAKGNSSFLLLFNCTPQPYAHLPHSKDLKVYLCSSFWEDNVPTVRQSLVKNLLIKNIKDLQVIQPLCSPYTIIIYWWTVLRKCANGMTLNFNKGSIENLWKERRPKTAINCAQTVKGCKIGPGEELWGRGSC